MANKIIFKEVVYRIVTMEVWQMSSEMKCEAKKLYIREETAWILEKVVLI